MEALTLNAVETMHLSALHNIAKYRPAMSTTSSGLGK